MIATVLFATGLAVTGLHPFRWQGRVAAGQSIEIRNTFGSIHAVQARGSEAEIAASGGHIQLVKTGDGIQIRTLDPGGASDAPVDFEIRVPKGVRFVGRTIKGSIEASELAGEVGAYTVDGDVQLSTTGGGQAQTVNGSIVAAVGAPAAGRHLRFSSVNGNITLRLPGRLNANVNAATTHGAIHSEFCLHVQSHAAGSKASGVLGKGGPALTLITSNGNIQVVRRYSGT